MNYKAMKRKNIKVLLVITILLNSIKYC